MEGGWEKQVDGRSSEKKVDGRSSEGNEVIIDNDRVFGLSNCVDGDPIYTVEKTGGQFRKRI